MRLFGDAGQTSSTPVETHKPGRVGCRLELGETVGGVQLAERTSSV